MSDLTPRQRILAARVDVGEDTNAYVRVGRALEIADELEAAQRDCAAWEANCRELQRELAQVRADRDEAKAQARRLMTRLEIGTSTDHLGTVRAYMGREPSEWHRIEDERDALAAKVKELEQSNKQDRESLGMRVREVWIKWAMEQPTPKSSWLTPWEQLSEPDKEVDRRIGETLAKEATNTLARQCAAKDEALQLLKVWMSKHDMPHGTKCRGLYAEMGSGDRTCTCGYEEALNVLSAALSPDAGKDYVRRDESDTARLDVAEWEGR